MGDFIYNVARGRVQELAARVNGNDPANSAFVLVVIDANAVSDATLKDLDTLSDVLGTAANEVTNTNYARKTIDNTGGLTTTVDDTNDWTVLDLGDQTWTSVAAGDAWEDLIVCYDSDTTAGTDANIIPLLQYDAPITPDGSNITLTINANGLLRSA